MTEENHGRRPSLDLQFHATVLHGGKEVTHREFERMGAVPSMEKSREVWTKEPTH